MVDEKSPRKSLAIPNPNSIQWHKTQGINLEPNSHFFPGRILPSPKNLKGTDLEDLQDLVCLFLGHDGVVVEAAELALQPEGVDVPGVQVLLLGAHQLPCGHQLPNPKYSHHFSALGTVQGHKIQKNPKKSH